jgi:hypothetical protein
MLGGWDLAGSAFPSDEITIFTFTGKRLYTTPLATNIANHWG